MIVLYEDRKMKRGVDCGHIIKFVDKYCTKKCKRIKKNKKDVCYSKCEQKFPELEECKRNPSKEFFKRIFKGDV